VLTSGSRRIAHLLFPQKEKAHAPGMGFLQANWNVLVVDDNFRTEGLGTGAA
jgi:hypothetical protein